jgi:hypothetical protein
LPTTTSLQPIPVPRASGLAAERRGPEFGARPACRRPNGRSRCGSALLEQLWLLLITGIVLATTVVGGARLLDAAITRESASDLADLFAIARDQAMATGRRTAVHLDASAGRAIVHAESDTVLRLELLGPRAVVLETTRDSMAYSASGLGYGAANLRAIVRRGASADTITVSRLGRVRR